MFNRRSSKKKRFFLLESNNSVQTKSKKHRNRWLNLLAKIFLIHQIFGFFKKSFLLVVFFFCMGAFIVFAFFSPYFKIKEFSISRTDSSINIEAIEEALAPVYGMNLLFIDKLAIKEILLTKFPMFESVVLTEEFPSRLVIDISVSVPIFSVLNEETANHFTISKDGVVLSRQTNLQVSELKLKNYPTIVQVGDNFISADFLNKILETTKILSTDFEITSKETILYLYAQEFHVIAANDTAFWFDLRRPVIDQLKLLKYAPERFLFGKKAIDHVDLRIPNQISYK